VCAGSAQSCISGVWTENYASIPSHEQPEISCDGLDNNCDGQTDELCQDWSYRKMITINHTKVAGDLSDFPVLIDLTDSDLATHAQPDGDDILFRAEDTTTKLSHEIERYDSGTGKLTAWVKIPSLSSTQDTIIYLYYGNENAENQQDAKNVWDSDYLAVQHMKETSGTIYDSTINHNNGNPINGIALGIKGKIDGGDQFDGVDDRVVLPQVFSIENQFTFEAWINSSNKQGYIISQRDNLSRGAFLQYNPSTFQFFLNNNQKAVRSTTPNAWHYVVGVFDGTTARLYIDNITPVSVVGNITWPNENLIIGDRSALGRAFSGTLDEIRLSKTARSEAYIKTSYNNQNNPAAFAVAGTAESLFVAQAPAYCISDADCLAYNLPSVVECSYLPLEGAHDTNPYTWDYRPEFVSSCVDGLCIVGGEIIMHTCDVELCSAECDATHVCVEGKTCLSDCTCV
jgi:hypothetical protein